MADLSRRGVLGAMAALSVPPAARAQPLPFGPSRRDEVVIGIPSDVPSWDPQLRPGPVGHAIMKAVFDQPIELDARLGLRPAVIRAWQLSDDARSLELDLRDDVPFHDGSRLTSEDLRWSFLERFRDIDGGGPQVEASRLWPALSDIEMAGPARAVFRFAAPVPGAAMRLAGLGSFVVPKYHMQLMGAAGFGRRPVGSGPYRLVEHRPGSRIVLEHAAPHWSGVAPIRRVVLEIMRESATRALAVRGGRLDLALALPARIASELGEGPELGAEVRTVEQVVLLDLRPSGHFAQRNVRLAAHHAIDKRALSQAFSNGLAPALAMPATPSSPWFFDDVVVPYEPNLAMLLLERTGFSRADPARVRLATTSGQFPGDRDIARAIVGMWRAVGIEADLRVIDPAAAAEGQRQARQSEAALSLLDVDLEGPDERIPAQITPVSLFGTLDREVSASSPVSVGDAAARSAEQGDWRGAMRGLVEEGRCIPLLQGIQSLVHRSGLSCPAHARGWITPQSLVWI